MAKLNLTTIKSKFREKWSSQWNASDFKKASAALLILGATAFLMQFHSQKPPQANEASLESMDTFIPEGHALLPIQISNYESLDQVVGQFGVVDLYTMPLNPSDKAVRVGYGVKIVRNPRNPQHFSILVPHAQAQEIMSKGDEFSVSVRNPKMTGTNIVIKKKKQARRSIVFETESQ